MTRTGPSRARTRVKHVTSCGNTLSNRQQCQQRTSAITTWMVHTGDSALCRNNWSNTPPCSLRQFRQRCLAQRSRRASRANLWLRDRNTPVILTVALPIIILIVVAVPYFYHRINHATYASSAQLNIQRLLALNVAACDPLTALSSAKLLGCKTNI
jgi:hypothetical protein